MLSPSVFAKRLQLVAGVEHVRRNGIGSVVAPEARHESTPTTGTCQLTSPGNRILGAIKLVSRNGEQQAAKDKSDQEVGSELGGSRYRYVSDVDLRRETRSTRFTLYG